jgi:hypothetical protein
MSVDKRLEQLAVSIDAHPVDVDTALMEVEKMDQKAKMRRGVLLAVAAAAVVVAAGIIWGSGLWDIGSSGSQIAPVDQPTGSEVDGAAGGSVPDDLTGVWAASIARGKPPSTFLTLADDGSWSMGRTPQGTDYDTGLFTVHGALLTLQTDPGGGCDGSGATYTMSYADDEVLTFDVVSDRCDGRAGDMAAMRFTRIDPEPDPVPRGHSTW